MVCVPFYDSNSEIPFITIIRNTSARCSNIPRVYSDFVECYCSPHSIFCFLCTFISNRAIRNRDSTITFGKGYWPVNHWPFCNYPLYTGCFWRRELWKICTVPEKICFYCNPIFTMVMDHSRKSETMRLPYFYLFYWEQ